ncbi:hypothetical protein [Natronoglomus mannanivorans]|uniref:Uncharacterized protein n=1 Tax=Natronoglomus mannanivorans TaxID=2979990 RepID=A0AAP3E457_9EURY|nr:hypothetical protein [Halobacteria archaeon AArc-xg1-1]
MPSGLEPTEEYDGRITVALLEDSGESERVQCSSYERAIELVEEHQATVTVAKIVDRDGDVVFTSAEMDIETWAREWEHAKRRLSVDVEEYDCPYDDRACFADDLCVQCQMDAIRER